MCLIAGVLCSCLPPLELGAGHAAHHGHGHVFLTADSHFVEALLKIVDDQKKLRDMIPSYVNSGARESHARIMQMLDSAKRVLDKTEARIAEPPAPNITSRINQGTFQSKRPHTLNLSAAPCHVLTCASHATQQ